MTEYQDHLILTQGIHLQVREYPRKADAMLFLHFGGANLLMWQRVIPAFKDRYHLILVDLRDHGKSDKPQAGDNIDQMACDLIGVLDYLQVKQVHIIGSSLGAEVGLSLAANYPEQVKSLVCDGALYSEYGPYGIWPGSEKEFRGYVEKQLAVIRDRQVESFPSIAAFVEARKKVLLEYGTWNAAIETFIEYDAHQLEDGTFTRSFGRQAAENYMRSYYDCRFEDYYRQVKCPVLMVTSDEEPENPLEKAATLKMSELPANSLLAVVPGWNHPYGWMLDPDAMVKIVLNFLDKVTG
jgi:pimeloyl-ACP methyl ester carboxylesterase